VGDRLHEIAAQIISGLVIVASGLAYAPALCAIPAGIYYCILLWEKIREMRRLHDARS